MGLGAGIDTKPYTKTNIVVDTIFVVKKPNQIWMIINQRVRAWRRRCCRFGRAVATGPNSIITCWWAPEAMEIHKIWNNDGGHLSQVTRTPQGTHVMMASHFASVMGRSPSGYLSSRQSSVQDKYITCVWFGAINLNVMWSFCAASLFGQKQHIHYILCDGLCLLDEKKNIIHKHNPKSISASASSPHTYYVGLMIIIC